LNITCNFPYCNHQVHRDFFITLYIAPIDEQCHNSKNAYFELRPQEVCLRPYLPNGIASHICFLKWPREGRIVVALLMRLHRPGQWFFLPPENLYCFSCDSVLLQVRYIYIHTHTYTHNIKLPVQCRSSHELGSLLVSTY
jgi:hypothetical protein